MGRNGVGFVWWSGLGVMWRERGGLCIFLVWGGVELYFWGYLLFSLYMRSKFPFYYHLVFFVFIYFIYFFWETGINQMSMSRLLETPPAVLFMLTNILAIFGTYVVNFYTFCGWFLSRKRFLLYLVSVPVTLLFFAGLRYFIEEVVVYQLTGFHNYSESSRAIGYYIKDNFFFGLPAVVFSTLIYLAWQFQLTQKSNHLLQSENEKAKLQLLKSQISPHFLFNTLNSFYSDMAEKDPKNAEDLLALSDLLRYVITENDKEDVMLSKELAFLHNYFRLQEKRFEDRLLLKLEVDGDSGNRKILPSVLIHFAENIFKHGVLNNKDKQAYIRIAIGNAFLEITTFNFVQEGDNYSSTGIGFDNLIKRLEYSHKDNYTLTRNKENDTFMTYLKIPLTA